ncbi:hypothetical protein [Parabacteroides gordonii]|uniref:Uncharacterized protein n=2 Tax=Parabacteroides gordonii MS-1 = DSM 23371 TaxID=1203610 RepID=A0A0F5IYD6_9BACT|nr:hypothetical protein [Parabacteroides gordonii]KKB50225.1 hypothetical protein HMPREF1536_04204 [Parabacteroides gordonii MS-1 = DSM 23371]MCA5585419.1 hypothetical protein [Parabacteroides gordonii]RGP08278.1 hypothetical protein DXB27_24745 [Parabacteroides gordonii]
MKKVIKMEMKKINIENDNQEVMKKESVSFLRRKRHGVKLLENLTVMAAKVVTFNDRGKVLVTI